MSETKKLETIISTTTTTNIDETLHTFAAENSLAASECDFKIKDIETYVKDSSDIDFNLTHENIKDLYKDTDEILNNHVQFKQIYKISIYPKPVSKIKLIGEVVIDDAAVKPYLILSPSSHIPYKSYQPNVLLRLLFSEINKIKAKHRIIIGLFDESMIKTLRSLVKYIYAEKFLKKVKIPLMKGILPDITQDGKLIMSFKRKKNTHTQFIEVDENEVLVKYLKPIFGKNGLDCFGKEISGDFGGGDKDLEQYVNEKNIAIEETETKKTYISKIKGFVIFNKNTFSVENKVNLGKISRLEGSVSKQEKNNIEVTVSHTDTTQDGVGEGVKLTSEYINVDGFVGSRSVIEANDLNIDGATHKDSKQFAKHATIKRHMGTLRCHHAKVNLLEGGVIHASTVEVDTCLGGSIHAQDVTIKQVKSHTKVYASNSIKINLISGEDNYLIIDYKKVTVLMNKINWLLKEIDDLEFYLEEAERHEPEKMKEIEYEIKKRHNEIDLIKNSTKKARISIKELVRGYNTIKFSINDTHEIVYKTKPQRYDDFYLEIDENKATLHPVDKTISLN